MKSHNTKSNLTISEIPQAQMSKMKSVPGSQQNMKLRFAARNDSNMGRSTVTGISNGKMKDYQETMATIQNKLTSKNDLH